MLALRGEAEVARRARWPPVRPGVGQARPRSTSRSATRTCAPVATSPRQRVRDLDLAGHRAPRCASPPSPASADRSSPRRRTASSGWPCVRAYNDWMIDEWCGGGPRSPDPADHHAALGRRARGRRGASGARRRARVRSPSPRTPPRSGCPRCTTAGSTGIRCSPPARTRACRSARTSGRRRSCRTRPTTPRRSSWPRCRRTWPRSALADWLYSGLFVRHPAQALPLGRRDRLDPGDPRAGRLRVRALRAAAEDGHRLRPHRHGLGRRR